MALSLLLAVPARAQIAPGPLARPHRTLEGATRCLSCHPVARRESMDRSCLACHRDIAWLLSARRGLHAREGSARCSSCHPDHAGVEFRLVSWSEDSVRHFDHRRAGWSLEGAHTGTECGDCHTPKYRRGRAAALAPAGAPGQWTGLDAGCVSCHSDVHRGRLQGPCTGCHDTRQWGPAPGFDHDSTRYPLTGRHRPLACVECHRAGTSGDRMDLALPELSFPQCSACHKDPHAGGLGVGCGDCHVTSSFRDRGSRSFDHNRTRYPLRGGHAAVSCGECHGRANERPRPASGRCGDCHTDAHAGTASVAGSPADCAACHDERAFRRSTFPVPDHARTRYPLEGKHRSVACEQCHTRVKGTELGPARVVLQPPFAGCPACHADPHRGQATPISGECAACHSPAGWSRSALTPAQHAVLGFPLEDRHAEISCSDCHALGRGGPVFRLGKKACADCHADPHEARYPDCASCHTARAFRPSTVDSAAHSAWRLPLEGAHRAVPCVSCHQALARSSSGPARVGQRAGVDRLLLHDDRIACGACHQDPHAGQFTTGTSRSCESCHGVQAFRPADRFDHRRDAGFPLDRGHERVACAACHPQGRYRGTPARCEACHQ